MTTIIQKIPLLFLLLTALLLSTLSQAASSPQKALLIYSYHPSFPTSAKALAGLKDAFQDDNVIIDIEYMDSKRQFDEVSKEIFINALQHKLSKREAYDAIFVADDNALNLAIEFRHLLFPQTPVLFFGVNDSEKAFSLDDESWVTGVIESTSFEDTLNLSQSIFPQRNQLNIIVDRTTSGQADLKNLLKLEDQFKNFTFNTISLNQFSWDELSRLLNRFDESEIILLLSAYVDVLGVEMSFDESLKLIANNTNAPILHSWEHGFGNGVFGGVVVSHYEQARQAGLMAKRLFSGTPLSQIKILSQSPNIPTFDYAHLTRFGIKERDLPKNSKILFKPESVWEQYFVVILSTIIIVAILLISAIHLTIKNIQIKKANRLNSEKSSFLRLLMNTLPDLVWIKDPQGVYLTCNKRFEGLFGAKEHEIIDKTDYDFVSKEIADFFRKHDLHSIEANGSVTNEETVTFADGHEEILETIKTPIYDSTDNSLLGVLGVARDITERKESEDANRLASIVFENTAESIMITDASCKIIEVNKAFTDITGFEREESIGKTPKILQSGHHDKLFYANMWNSINTTGKWMGEIINRRKNGSLFPVWQTISSVTSSINEITHYVSVSSDISKIKQSQEEIRHLAYHDSLTDLPNRRLLKDQIGQAIAFSARNDSKFTLLYIDLDNFKNINDSFGHPEGDQLLKVASRYLTENTSTTDFIARAGGDEFAILLNNIQSPKQAEQAARKILEVLTKEIPLADRTINISASIGICIYPHDGDTADDLLKNADAAMYRAKKQGRNTFQFYTEELTQNVKERLQIENELRHAIYNEELVLFYQPQINLQTKELEGAEALVRWTHPQYGMIPPDKFIPIAEESGLIIPLGEWVLNTAIKQTKTWLDKGFDIGRVAINLSGQQIEKKDFVKTVRTSLKNNHLSCEYIALEITETCIMNFESTAMTQLALLKDMGIELAIDDFGTGYSSLSYLKRLPIHKLKIDRAFIRDIPADADDMVISKTVIALGESLNFKVIAEGVETEEQVQFLRSVGCHQAQGYLFGKPLNIIDFEDYYIRNFAKDFKKVH